MSYRSMANEQRLFASGAWAWVAATLVVAGAIQVCLSFKYQEGVVSLITSYLIVLATGIVYGPLVFCYGQWDAIPLLEPLLEPQSYLSPNTAGSNEAQYARETRDEDADAGVGATRSESMEIEGARLESEDQTEARSDTDAESFEQLQNQNPDRPPRLHFLDNVKTFLTVVVVSFHINCAFGGCGNDWYLVVGDYPCAFRSFTKAVRLINQAYFMSLFFFISAYFTPSSYDRKGRTAFLRDKGLRLWIPAVVVTFTIVPVSLIIGWLTMGASPRYVPFPGHSWFLFWLLALNYAYVTIRKGDSDSDTAAAVPPGSSALLIPFPTIFHRYNVALVCGMATFAVCAVFGDVFYAMPVDIGSLPSDLLLFGVGVLAMRNQWFSQPMEQQMDVSVWSLRGNIVSDAVALVTFIPNLSKFGVGWHLVYYLLAGFFCVDMPLAVLQLFQKHFDVQSRTSRFLADSAYTVYLIHPLVIASVTSGFIKVYNSLYPDAITFVGSQQVPVSTSHLEGPYDGSLHLAIGYVVVNLVSHAIVWPLAWRIRQLPGFKSIL